MVSLSSAPWRPMTNELMRGSWPRGYKYPEWRLGQGGVRLGLEMGWAYRPGHISAQPTASFAQCWFLSLLQSSLICMWALVITFSTDWMKLLVPQDSAVLWLGPRSFSSSRVSSLGFLESCLLHYLTYTGLQGLVIRCLMNLSRKSCFQR
jgi:hypothetical protein